MVGAFAVAALVGLAAVAGREREAEPFELETRAVEPIRAPSSETLVDAIVAQLPYERGRDTRGAPADGVFAEWIDLLRATVYRDQAARNGLDPAPLDRRLARIGGEDRPNETYLTATDDATRRLVRANARRLGMRLLSLRFLHPEGIPVPVATLSAPPDLVRRSGGAPLGASVFATVADETRSLGWYSDVVDERGEWVQSEGLVPAAGSGVFVTRFPGATACGGAIFCRVHG